MPTSPNIKGKNAKLTFQLSQDNGKSKNLVIRCTSWELKPNVTEIADGICGEDRDDIDVEINFYEVQFECLVRNTELLSAFLNHQRGRDLKVAMAESAVGILIQPNDGTQAAFQVRKYVLGAWSFGAGGRVERIKVPVPGRALYVDPLPSL
jgi:hypothetical protein